jgi:hypothetical protein
VGAIKITSNADKVARQIRAYAGQLQSKYSKALERIAQLGGGTAKVKFANALYAGDNDVTVDVKRVSATKYQVIASGKTVLFIEFGTGVAYPELVEPSGLTYIHGTYGQFKGLNPKGWVYVGETGNIGHAVGGKGAVHTTGNPPARAMYDASKDMRAEITRIFREEFRYK